MQRSLIEMLHTYALVHIFFTKVSLCSQLMGRKSMTSCVEQNLNNICSLLLPLSESSWAQCAIAVAAVFLLCPKAAATVMIFFKRKKRFLACVWSRRKWILACLSGLYSFINSILRLTFIKHCITGGNTEIFDIGSVKIVRKSMKYGTLPLAKIQA